jgi:hypothetical protein
VDRHLTGARIREHHRDEEGAHPVWAPLRQRLGALEQSPDPPDAGSQDDPDPAAVSVVDLQARVGKRLAHGDHRKLGETVHAPGVAPAEMRLRIEALDLGGKASLERGGIEMSDPADARFPGKDSLPGRVDVVAKGADAADTGDHHADARQDPSSGPARAMLPI